MKCPVKLIKIEKVGQTIITEFCVKFFARRGSATKYVNISVTSSTASQSLHAGTFNLVILNFIKISQVLNFAILRR